MTTVVSVATILGGITRFMWSFGIDKFGFKKVFALLLIIQIIISATISSIAEYKILYLIWVCFSMICEGGLFSMFPTLCSYQFD